MKDHIKQNKGLFLIFSVAVLILFYLLGYYYYRGHFMAGTTAGGYSIAGKTPLQAKQRLEKKYSQQTLTLSEDGKELGWVDMEPFAIKVDGVSELEGALTKQNPYLWPFARFMKAQNVDISSSIHFEAADLEAMLDGLAINNEERAPMQNASLHKGDDGSLEVIDEVYGEQIDANSLGRALGEHLYAGKATLPLEEAYIQPQVKVGSQELEQQIDLLEKMENTSITLLFDGREVYIEPEAIASWVYVGEEGQLDVDLEAVEDYLLTEVNQPYASLYQSHLFESTYQGEVWVPAGTFGWAIDRFEEAPILAEMVKEGGEHFREPIITGSGYGEAYEIGPNYVEVDLDYQMMLIYKDYEKVLETPIVSGMHLTETIPGAYQVWQKLENTKLSGYDPVNESDYSIPVSYWIAFDHQEQGIHDASWQSAFGGTAYVHGGSLGCINTPPAIMPEVYQLIDIGMPVIIFKTNGT